MYSMKIVVLVLFIAFTFTAASCQNLFDIVDSTGDTVPPELTLLSPVDGSSVQSTVELAGTATDNIRVSTVRVRVNSGNYQNAAGINNWYFSYAPTGLTNSGRDILDIIATDDSGNIASLSLTLYFAYTNISDITNYIVLTNSYDVYTTNLTVISDTNTVIITNIDVITNYYLQNGFAVVSHFAGTGVGGLSNGTALQSRFLNPAEMVCDDDGNIYVADNFNHVIRKIDTAGIVTTFAGRGTSGYQDGTNTNSAFYVPTGLALDADGNLYVSEQFNRRIRKITPEGVVTTFAGSGSIGNIDGNGTNASFTQPMGIAMDKNGYLYVADLGAHCIRRISPSGNVITFAGFANSSGYINGVTNAARFTFPRSIAVDENDNVFITDGGNYMVRVISNNGMVYTYAGTNTIGFKDGFQFNSLFGGLGGLAFDKSGILYVADTGNNCIRRIEKNSLVSTVTGVTNAGFVDGIVQQAQFTTPYGLVFDKDNNLLVTELNAHRIRKMTR